MTTRSSISSRRKGGRFLSDALKSMGVVRSESPVTGPAEQAVPTGEKEPEAPETSRP